MTTYTLLGGNMDEAEAAAAMAAVTCLLEEAEAAGGAQPDARLPGWHEAAKLIAQGLIPTRLPAPPRWGSIERLRRTIRGGGGVVGQ